jgi:hypothetical protein
MSVEKIIKVSVVIGSLGIAVYGSSAAYKVYRRTKEQEMGGNTKNYEQHYINDFIRKISRISK